MTMDEVEDDNYMSKRKMLAPRRVILVRVIVPTQVLTLPHLSCL